MKIMKLIRRAQNETSNPSVDKSVSSEPEIMVDLGKKSIPMPNKIRNAINNKIHEILKPNYFSQVPLDEMFNALETNGVIPLQEDGTRWSGFVMSAGECGSNKAASCPPIKIELGMKVADEYFPLKNLLILTICTMENGKYEVVGYIS